MSLLSQMSEKFIIMEKTRSSDGEGGYTTTWADGEEIMLSVRHDTTIEAQRAETDGTASAYTFFAEMPCPLEYHDVVKRHSDGQYFRITSDANETKTPPMSTMNLTTLTAERWTLAT